MSENEKYCWDEFRDWCEDSGIRLDHPDEYDEWWECWKAAIDAKLSYGDNS